MEFAQYIAGIHVLIDLQNQLSDLLRDQCFYLWTEHSPVNQADPKRGLFHSPLDQEGKQILDEAIHSIEALDYSKGEDGRATLKLKGALGVSAAVIDQALRVNQQKATLRELQNQLTVNIPKGRSLASILEKQTAIRSVLSHAGIGRLNLNHVRRYLPVIETTPYRISFLEKKSPSITRITIAEAEQRLLDLNTDQARVDLQALGRLAAGSELAIVNPKNLPAMKATIFTNEAGQKENSQIHAPLPILFPGERSEPPRLHTGGFRAPATRNDVTISTETYLDSIHAHLYLST